MRERKYETHTQKRNSTTYTHTYKHKQTHTQKNKIHTHTHTQKNKIHTHTHTQHTPHTHTHIAHTHAQTTKTYNQRPKRHRLILRRKQRKGCGPRTLYTLMQRRKRIPPQSLYHILHRGEVFTRHTHHLRQRHRQRPPRIDRNPRERRSAPPVCACAHQVVYVCVCVCVRVVEQQELTAGSEEEIAEEEELEE